MWKFECYQDASGQYRWRLKADNGQIVATPGEGYTTMAGAKAAAQNVKANAGSATVE